MSCLREMSDSVYLQYHALKHADPFKPGHLVLLKVFSPTSSSSNSLTVLFNF